MSDIGLDVSLIAKCLQTIADEIGTLTHIEDEISKLAEDVRDLNRSIDYLTDKIDELKESKNERNN